MDFFQKVDLNQHFPIYRPLNRHIQKNIKTSALANHAAIFPGISLSTRSHGAGNPSIPPGLQNHD